MPEELKGHLIDPRTPSRKSKIALAPRPDFERLKKGRLLLYDNGKLDVGNYGLLLQEIESILTGHGLKHIEVYRQTIRGKTQEGIYQLAAEIAELDIDAAILTLADMGVSTAMVILSMALEELGIPNVCITAGPGSQLSQAAAWFRAGRLCLLPVDIYPGSTGTEIGEEINRCTEPLLTFLTASPQQLLELSAIKSEHDQHPPHPSGFIHLNESILKNQSSWKPFQVDAETVLDEFEQLSIGDGLPVIPPTEDKVRSMLQYCFLPEHHLFISNVGPAGNDITVRDLAIAAVMAGCKPEYMPVLISALTAMCKPSYNLFQAVTTSYSGGYLVLISGPLAQELNINSAQGCIGPGFRANATIGRAINLTLRNCCRIITGFSDLACLSSPAEYTYCFAEDVLSSPWPTINAERFNARTTTVSVMMAEGPHNIMDLASTNAKDFLETASDCCTTLGSNNAYLPGSLVIVITPDHARLLSQGGFTKNDIRRYIHKTVGHPVHRLQKRGIVGMWSKQKGENDFFKVTHSPADIEVVVAGGKGGHSAVILPWSLHSKLTLEPVLCPDGSIPKKIEDFRASGDLKIE